MTNYNPTTSRSARGFSLVEMLVVIAIIAVISGLIIGGVAKVKAGSKESQAQTILTNLMGNAGLYETKTQYAVGHINDSIMDWTNGPWKTNSPDASSPTANFIAKYVNQENNGNVSYAAHDNDYYMERANLYIERFIWAAHQLPDIRENLPALGAAFTDNDNDGFMEVVDPWGNPIAYAYGVSHSDKATDDDFLPEHKSAFFASAGKDQKWGMTRKRYAGESDAAWESFKKTDDYKDSLDNLYSFDLDRSAALRGN